ncbi:MAG: GntR family transcriptional regulator [Acidimicrobiia bacterium]|nr:MAG: GntR family transcriptional regulator [Acidimicrobiia bacterium]
MLEHLRSGQGLSRPVTLSAYRVLAGAIESAHVQPGERLPSEREMAEAVGVSRQTLRKALSSLEDEGIVWSEPGRGWFVRADPLSDSSSTLQSFTSLAAERGLRAGAQILLTNVRAATLDEATALRIAPSSEVFELHRLRLLDGNPIVIGVLVFVGSRVQPLIGIDLTDRSIFNDLEEQCGIRPWRTDYVIQALAATARQAELLLLQPGSPVLVGSGTTFDADGQPVCIGTDTYRGDSYRFEASLFRDR